MRFRLKTALGIGILSMMLPLASFAYNLVLTVDSSQPNLTMNAIWNIAGPVNMTFTAANGVVYCSDVVQGYTCTVFKLYAEIYEDYTSLYNQLAAIDGTNWPIYNQVKSQPQGSETFPLGEGKDQKLMDKAVLRHTLPVNLTEISKNK